jgi:hypothetical protein
MRREYKRKEKNEFHELRSHPLYMRWAGIKQRCNNPKDTGYHNYGKRGITVCDEWNNSFKSFYDDMMEGFNVDLFIDRIDNSKGYSKENCRWVTKSFNESNKRQKAGRTLPKGVWLDKRNGRYGSEITINKKKYSLGKFSTIEEASDAFNIIHKEWYGF